MIDVHIEPELLAMTADTEQINQLVAAYMPSAPPFDTPEGLAELRKGTALELHPPVEGVEQLDLPGPAGPVPARVLHPAGTPVAVYLDIHGGGWCIGAAASHDVANAALTESCGVAVVSIDYRLAPEDPWPAGPDDAYAAACWLLEHAATELGTDRLLIGGGSAGAHLASLTLLRVRDTLGAEAVRRFVGAVLDAGCYDLGLTPSARDSHDKLVIPRATLDACTAAFLPGLEPEARRDPTYSPLYADLAGLPPALFVVGTDDPLLDDSLFMYERWTAAGNRAELGVYPMSLHAFRSFPTALARHATDRVHAFVRDCLAG